MFELRRVKYSRRRRLYDNNNNNIIVLVVSYVSRYRHLIISTHRYLELRKKLQTEVLYYVIIVLLYTLYTVHRSHTPHALYVVIIQFVRFERVKTIYLELNMFQKYDIII